MKGQNLKKKDEIHIFDTIQAAWNHKLLLVITTTLFFVLGSIYTYNYKDSHKIIIQLTLNSQPPEYDLWMIKRDFKKIFYNNDTYQTWKTINETTLLEYKDFRQRNVLDHHESNYPESNLTVIFTDKSKIIIKTNDLSLVDDLYDYINFTNSKLTQTYLSKTKKEMAKAEAIFKEYGMTGDGYQIFLRMSRFFDRISNASNIFVIEYPSKPHKETLGKNTILVMFSLFGLFIGIILALFRSELIAYKQTNNKNHL